MVYFRQYNGTGRIQDKIPCFNQETFTDLLSNCEFLNSGIVSTKNYLEPKQTNSKYTTITTSDGVQIKFNMHEDDVITYNKNMLIDAPPEALNNFLNLIGVKHLSIPNSPVMQMRYVFSFGVSGRQDITKDHIPTLKYIQNYIKTELLKDLYPEYAKLPNIDIDRFYPYIDTSDYEKVREKTYGFRVYAEYVPLIGQCGTRTYNLYDIMCLTKFINMIELYGDCKVKFPEMQANTKIDEPEMFSAMKGASEINLPKVNEIIKSYKVLTCDIKIGPGFAAILTNNDGNKFFFIEIKYIKSQPVHKLLQRFILPYTVIKFYEIDAKTNNKILRRLFRPSIHAYVTKDSMNAELYNKPIVPIVQKLIEYAKTIDGGNSGNDDINYVYNDDTTIIGDQKSGGEHYSAIVTKSSDNSLKDDSGLLINRDVTASKFEIVKYNIWIVPNSVMNNINTILTVPNALHNYTEKQLQEFVTLTNESIDYIRSKDKTKNKYLVYFTAPSQKTHESTHLKYDSSKAVAYEDDAMSTHCSDRKFRLHFYEKERVLIEKYPKLYTDWKSECFTNISQ